MKKLLCLLCVALMMLPVCAMAGATIEAQHVAVGRPYIGYASNSYVVISADGYQAFGTTGSPCARCIPVWALPSRAITIRIPRSLMR